LFREERNTGWQAVVDVCQAYVRFALNQDVTARALLGRALMRQQPRDAQPKKLQAVRRLLAGMDSTRLTVSDLLKLLR
jgi:hypothetical protein